MFLFAAMNLSVGAVIEIAFCPSGTNRTVSVSGIVRRKAMYLYGIEFLSPVAAGVLKSPFLQAHNDKMADSTTVTR